MIWIQVSSTNNVEFRVLNREIKNYDYIAVEAMPIIDDNQVSSLLHHQSKGEYNLYKQLKKIDVYFFW